MTRWLLDAVGHDRVVELRTRWRRRRASPFDADRRRMATVHVDDADTGTIELLVKGAPEAVLGRCTRVTGGGRVDGAQGARITAHINALAAAGARVLTLARRTLEAVPDDVERVVADLELIGIVGLRDPVRSAAPAPTRRHVT